MLKKQKISVLAAIIYTLIMAAGMYTLGHIVGGNYGDTTMSKTLIYFEIAMTIFAIIVYLKYFKGQSFGKINKKPRKLFVFTFTVMILIETIMIGILFSSKLADKDVSLIILIFATTILVGISEELIYRGIVLQAFLENNPKHKAILISSLFFSSLHSVNILSGVTASGMLIQLLLTFLVGITLACIAVELKNLLPLIIYHALWDFLLIAGKAADVEYSFLEIVQVPFEILMGLILFYVIKKEK